MNKKARKIALNGIITLKAKENSIVGLKDLNLEAPKTKEVVDVIRNIGLQDKKLLVVLDKKNDNLTKSLRNISNVKYITVGYLNPFDVMGASKVVFMESALQLINEK
ncbi:TPA: 50S ribosomal protein L4 [Patescibacteria group bacterium]|nr:50S ribosomal protein L4 [Candidatus Gracilibacteria bacterium]